MTTQDAVDIFKSLLQKAVRRGNIEMAVHAVKFLTTHDFPWLRNRLAVLTFEECWTYGENVILSDERQVVAKQISRLATTIKNRNAAGLGSLANYYNEGDNSVLDGGNDDEAIRQVADGFVRSDAYWRKLGSTALTSQQKKIVTNAREAFDMAIFPWDKCFMVAAAYLATSNRIPVTTISIPSAEEFPLWAAIDKHTPIGHAAICRAARRIDFDEEKAQWLVFYLEGAKCNQVVQSPWWEREIAWRLRQLELTMSEAEKLWGMLKPVLIDETKNVAEELRVLIGQ